jgi:hypothetical protein
MRSAARSRREVLSSSIILDKFMPERSVISPSVTQQAGAVELDKNLPTTERMATNGYV